MGTVVDPVALFSPKLREAIRQLEALAGRQHELEARLREVIVALAELHRQAEQAVFETIEAGPAAAEQRAEVQRRIAALEAEAETLRAALQRLPAQVARRRAEIEAQARREQAAGLEREEAAFRAAVIERILPRFAEIAEIVPELKPIWDRWWAWTEAPYARHRAELGRFGMPVPEAFESLLIFVRYVVAQFGDRLESMTR